MTYKVLIVDDSKLARMLLGKRLMELLPSCISFEAIDADEALAIVQGEGIQIVLLDVNMPGRSGLDLADQLQGLDKNIVVAITSANHQMETISRAESAGAVFLQKPVSKPALSEFLVDALARLSK